MTPCAMQPRLEEWSRGGSLEPMPTELELHLPSCEPCRGLALSVIRARSLGELLPTVTLDRQRHDAMKFRLMAAARQSGSFHHGSRGRTGIGLRTFTLAAIFGGAAAAAAGATVAAKHWHFDGYGERSAAETSPIAPLGVTNLSAERWLLQPQTPQLLQLPSPSALGERAPARSSALTAGASSGPTHADASSVTAAPAVPDPGDAAFAQAFAALRSGRAREAANRFDALLASPTLDAARRADVLYWCAQAQRQSGNQGVALERSAQLVQQYPKSPFAADAALMLGEAALASQHFDDAARYLNQASRSTHQVVRERAQKALGKLAQATAK